VAARITAARVNSGDVRIGVVIPDGRKAADREIQEPPQVLEHWIPGQTFGPPGMTRDRGRTA
jgi:hypothetical protein